MSSVAWPAEGGEEKGEMVLGCYRGVVYYRSEHFVCVVCVCISKKEFVEAGQFSNSKPKGRFTSDFRSHCYLQRCTVSMCLIVFCFL